MKGGRRAGSGDGARGQVPAHSDRAAVIARRVGAGAVPCVEGTVQKPGEYYLYGCIPVVEVPFMCERPKNITGYSFPPGVFEQLTGFFVVSGVACGDGYGAKAAGWPQAKPCSAGNMTHPEPYILDGCELCPTLPNASCMAC